MERIFNEDGTITVKYTKEERKQLDKEYLEKTAEYMLSADYKKRFIAEYRQLFYRLKKLGELLEKYREGSLDFEPMCSLELLERQFDAMREYTKVLVERARIENIELWKENLNE